MVGDFDLASTRLQAGKFWRSLGDGSRPDEALCERVPLPSWHPTSGRTPGGGG